MVIFYAFCRVMWFASAEATTSRASPWSKVCWPMVVCACCSARATPATVPAGLESANASLCVVASLMPTSAFSTWSSSRKVLWIVLRWVGCALFSQDIWGRTRQCTTIVCTQMLCKKLTILGGNKTLNFINLFNVYGTPVDPFWLVSSH